MKVKISESEFEALHEQHKLNTVIGVVKESMMEFAKETFLERFPNVYDGLKPVHRRILYDMYRWQNSGFTKASAIVGDIMNKYHPHGDAGIYGALVRMTQDFNMNYILVTPQGNWGSIGGDPPAAMRYTECKLSEFSKELLLNDISEDIVHFDKSYDGRYMEPSVLPCTIPHLLINGVYGIGGAAFSVHIPQHNLSEIVDLTIKIIDNPNISIDDIEIFPDFPTGGTITNPIEILEYYRGKREKASLKIRGNAYIDGNNVIINEIPFMTTTSAIKDAIIERLDWKTLGINDVIDNYNGLDVNITILLSKASNPNRVLSELYENNIIQKTFPIAFIALSDFHLYWYDIKGLIVEWLKFRRDTIRKQISNNIQRVYQKTHVIEALISVYDRIDDIIGIVKNASTHDEIVNKLMSKYNMTIIQAREISNMKLYELSKMSKNELIDKHEKLMNELKELKSKFNNKSIDNIIKHELLYAKEKYGRPRRTKIQYDIDTINNNINNEYIVTLNNDNTLSIMEYNKIDKVENRVLRAWNKNLSIVEVLKINPYKETLLMFTKKGYMYNFSDLVQQISYIQNTNSFSVITPSIKIRDDDSIIKIVPIPISDLNSKKGELLIVTDSMIKRVKLSSIPTKIGKDGSKFTNVSDTVSISNIHYINKKNKKHIITLSENGEVSKFPLDSVPVLNKTARGVNIKIGIYKIIDAQVCDDNDVLLIARASGDFIHIKSSDIPLKKRCQISKVVTEVYHDEPTDRLLSLNIIDGNIIFISTQYSLYVLDINNYRKTKIVNKNESSTYITSILITN